MGSEGASVALGRGELGSSTPIMPKGWILSSMMITPQRFDVLFEAFQRSKAEGLHNNICPPPASFESEILGLLARKNKLEGKYLSCEASQ
eukprot:1156700-Pelagomonas_calceolata.AAC.4